ncbi:MAG TPA: HAMP domain-containing sensor histidine kinase [Melioribacteraceae bacterium]|nr:HAMP domain-containing sensor histidine kinase [Melioribacteraceae bacterium]
MQGNYSEFEPEQKSFESIKEFKSLIETPETKPLALVAEGGFIQYCNKSFSNLFNLHEGDSINQVQSEPSLSIFVESLTVSKYSSFHFEIFLLQNLSSIPNNYYIDIDRVLVNDSQLMVFVFTSGSERRRIEDRINNLHNALEYGDVAVVITDDKGIINYSSRSFDNLLNSSIEYIYNGFLPDVMYNILSESEINSIKIAIKNKTEWISLVNTVIDGKKYYKELKLNPVVKNYVDSVNFILTVNDITEYIEKNQIILQAAERQKLIINNISDPIVIIKRENNIYKFESANEAFFADFLINKNVIKESFEEYNNHHVYKFLIEVITELDNLQLAVLSKNFSDTTSNKKYISKVSYFEEGNTGLRLYVTNFTDLTEQIKAEEQLRIAYEKEIQLNKLKSAFLANMSHEFRTPLNAIAGYSDLLEDDIKNKEYDFLSEYTTYLKEGVQRLVKLVDNILEISFLESGIDDLEKEACSVNYIIRSIFNLHLPRIHENELIGELDLDNIEPYILCDENKIIKILDNLVDNAIKYNSKNGKVILRSTIYEDFVYFHICDTGIGISESKLEKILKPFEQESDLAHTRNYEGAGLGLTIAHRLTLKLGGEFYINSIPDKGTEIKLKFPQLKR